ncbi:MAG TPA: tRNA pseudouridine(55) synthase TruB [Candidatus Aquilonibacter sp.]|nr:tRNA pseudouridine(55) synthase TruB [Candidatus Aquilonibacter sp.]
MNGVLIVDKPAGWTSHDVVNRLRRILGQRSVGHLGTLDPLATGVLPLVVGNLTRLAQFYTTSEKAYEGAIRFGFATDTYDAEGEPSPPAQSVDLSLDQVRQLAAGFVGEIDQMPPPFSAKKLHGVPAYKLARQRKEVAVQPVKVKVEEFEILGVEGPLAHFQARVSSGTYMRSIAHDMGQRLGCGAHLQSLRRTAVAEFTIAEAHTIEEIEAGAGKARVAVGASARDVYSSRNQSSDLETLFVHSRRLLPQLPSVTADEATAARIRAGRTVNLPELSRARQVKVFYGQTELIAIATRVAGTLFHPKLVFVCGD